MNDNFDFLQAINFQWCPFLDNSILHLALTTLDSVGAVEINTQPSNKTLYKNSIFL